MKSFVTLVLFTTIAAIATSSELTHSQVTMRGSYILYDIIIRNGRVIDGSGRPGINADIAINGDRIDRIGNLRGAKAKREIDARGQVVAPGFIDMLGQSEQYVLIDPRAMSKVMMGVTTEITGEGESIAPVNDRILKEQEDFNRRFDLTVDWRTFGEYFKRLDKQGAGVNLGSFVGATQVREYVIGYDNRPPSVSELTQMKKLVADAMKDGALGLSTSLQYVPARFAKTDEIVELAKVAHQYGGIYITHQRSEANAIDDSMKEVFEIARRANIPAEIWHFKTAYKKNWGRMPEMLRRIAVARSMLMKADTALLIGDPAMKIPRDQFRVFDLATLWHEFTGLGFVFAMWMARTDSLEKIRAVDFADARDEGLRNLDQVIATYSHNISFSADELRQYLSENI